VIAVETDLSIISPDESAQTAVVGLVMPGSNKPVLVKSYADFQRLFGSPEEETKEREHCP
jgi:hypothetical protein